MLSYRHPKKSFVKRVIAAKRPSLSPMARVRERAGSDEAFVPWIFAVTTTPVRCLSRLLLGWGSRTNSSDSRAWYLSHRKYLSAGSDAWCRLLKRGPSTDVAESPLPLLATYDDATYVTANQDIGLEILIVHCMASGLDQARFSGLLLFRTDLGRILSSPAWISLVSSDFSPHPALACSTASFSTVLNPRHSL